MGLVVENASHNRLRVSFLNRQAFKGGFADAAFADGAHHRYGASQAVDTTISGVTVADRLDDGKTRGLDAARNIAVKLVSVVDSAAGDKSSPAQV